MEVSSEKPLATCHGCKASRKTSPKKDGSGLKTPMGWRQVGDDLLCPTCKAARYYVRAVRVRIIGLTDDEPRETADFRKALSAAMNAAGRFANWYVQRLWESDLALSPLEKTKDGKVKLPKLGEVEFYRAATKAFPELAPSSIVAMAKMVRGWYASDRFAAIVALNRSVRSYRFGSLPIEIPKQAWSLRVGDDGKIIVRTQIGPGKSWSVKIGCDSRSSAQLRQMLDGDATPLALKLIRRTKFPTAGSSAKPTKAWFFRISTMFLRKPRRQSHQEITLTLGHDASSLLFGSLEGSDDVFEFPGDSIKTMIVGGDISDRRRQQEQSMRRGIWSRRKQERWSRDRTARCRSRRNKIKDQLKLAASSLARWCVSHGVTSVDYDIADRGFVPHFPWRELRDAIHCALENEGIALHVLDAGNEAGALAARGSETDA